MTNIEGGTTTGGRSLAQRPHGAAETPCCSATSSPSGKIDRYRSLLALSLILFVLTAVLRLFIIDRQGLWSDEVFSLAMATGHSLEHPAALAVPSLGDYIEAPTPTPFTAYLGYTQHENPPVGPDRVLRAVRLSDTSPPLYYLLLWAWTRAAGTSDAALRLFSVLWALACFPFVWLLAQEIGGRSAILPALVLFSVSPLSIYYSTEGRMYSMLWFLALSFTWMSLKLNQRGPHPTLLVLWILIGAAGLLTHYFYVFTLLACAAWLLIYPAKFSRLWLLGASAAIGVLIAPWYLRIPETLSLWRVTKDWLYWPSVPSRLIAALKLPWTFLSPSSNLWSSDHRLDYLAMAVLVALIILAIGKMRRRVFAEQRQLIWIWLVAVCLGPLIFDRLMGTFTTAVPRYAIAGMPAAFLLVALALGQLRIELRAALLILILVAWLPGTWNLLTSTVRSWEPFRQIASVLDDKVGESDVVIVHSIPSGVLGVARYLEKPISLFSWVGQLQQRRVPEDIQTLAEKYNRIVLVKIHTVGDPAPEETWLRNHSDLRQELSSEDVLFFVSRKDP
jgi:uncharacterized membrane protein